LLPSLAITYEDDSEAAGNVEQLGIEGAKGINQVLVEAATEKKNKANEWFKSGAYEDARQAYLKALRFLQQLSHRTEEEDEIVNQAKAVRISLLLNIAACDLKLWCYESVVENCNRVLEMEERHVKAMYRRGVACSHLGRLQEAMLDLRFVLQAIDASDTGTTRDVRREIDRVRQLMEGEKEEEKSMAKRMLGGTAIGRKGVPDTPAKA
jgi:tetratricopeptide (TPR) repeat protein